MAPSEIDPELAVRLDRIQRLTEALLRAQADSVVARQLADRINREVDATRVAIRALDAPFQVMTSSRRREPISWITSGRLRKS